MSDMALASPPRHPSDPANIPTHAELFFAFLRITLSGFGGTLPWTRRMFVEEKKWMTAEEFNDAYALCQFLPGPNIVNLTAVFGWRMRGWSGALAAWSGFLIFPFFLMVAAAIAYATYSDVDALRRALRGLAAAAAGLLVATVIKMALPLFKKVGPGPVVVIATGAAIGLMRWPLVTVLLVLAPVSIALAWWVRR
jgi:chromate transporter